MSGLSGRIPSPGPQPGKGGSKLSQMQAQFQQKQMAEKEAKLLAMLDNQQQRMIQHTNGLLNKYNNNTQSATTPLPPGKVRQMFEERRKGGTVPSTPVGKGIDKSYPLDPIVTPPIRTQTRSGNSIASISTNPTNSADAPKRSTAAPLPIQRPTNLGSSRKPSPPPTKQPPTPTSTSNNSNANSNYKPQNRTNSDKPRPLKSPGGGGGGVGSPMSLASASSSASGSGKGSPTLPPVARTTKYSDYASELDRREQSLSNKLKGMDLNSSNQKNKKTPPTPSNASSSTTKPLQRTTPSPVGSVKPPPRPKGSPPPGLEECKLCGRYFAPDRIGKHESVCKKVAQSTKKRKIFDPTKMRMQGTEAEPYIRIVSAKAAKPPPKEQPKKKDWRKKHEDFIATIRAAKEYQAHVDKGGNPADFAPPPPSDNSDYIQCPHCWRKFSEGAADRHIPKCKNIKSNKK